LPTAHVCSIVDSEDAGQNARIFPSVENPFRRSSIAPLPQRAWFFAEGEKSERGASERVFLAGENERVFSGSP
jgi:hypothetical protein